MSTENTAGDGSARKPGVVWKVIIVLCLLVGVVVVVWAKSAKDAKPAVIDASSKPAGKEVVEAPAKPVETARTDKSEAPVATPRLVDLGAGRCGMCKRMAPILEQLREDFKGRFEVVFIDVWKNAKAGEKYKIRMIPTQIFFDAAGKELFRHEGFYSRENILSKWEEHGYKFD